MQRVQKQGCESENAQRTAQAKFTSWSRENERANAIDDSPAMVAQRKKLNSLFGGAIQRVEDEELLQGKFETAQRVEEEEPLQGKFETAQRVEEEEPLQGKFEAVQRVEEEEPLQGKFETAQRVEEEEPLQGKFEAVQRVEEEEPLQGKFEAASSVQLKEEPAAKPNNTGLPDNLKSGIENLSGMSMDSVKVHYNSSQPAQLNALAYAQGTDIHVAPGQEQHLPHEAWHVVQQAQGRVKPTMQMKEGVPVNDDKGLEHEADVMGAKAVQMAGGEHDVQTNHLALNASDSARLLQMKTVSDDHVADDLQHPQASRLFAGATMIWWNGLPAPAKNSRATREASVNAGRANVSYEQLRNTTLKSSEGLRGWLGTDANEHMYVHVGSNIYTGGRDREKLPHPTLVGGDPDAKCAGTMSFDNSSKTVTITNESGHFRPGSVASGTMEFVRSIFPKGKGYKVKKQEV